MNNLPDLECILNTIVGEDEPSIFTEETTLQFIETVSLLIEEFMNENPTLISEPDFRDILLEEITEIFYIQFEELIRSIWHQLVEEELDELIEFAIELFCPERSFDDNLHLPNGAVDDKVVADDSITNVIESKINYLQNIPQPPQRTDVWYQFRHNLITASNAYKAFESQSTINQLIYEKCQPVKTINVEDSDVKMVNVNSTLHWGQKYEPVSVMIYQYKYNTVVEDFGCIQHASYKFLGASPDGINVDKTLPRYGRMLEIKNVVNREINGNPKKEYWIQMQLQMEVCDLDECDFLETKFVEYVDRETFFQDLHPTDTMDITISHDNKQKGVMIYFHTKEGKPFYEHKPLHIVCKSDIEMWEDERVAFHENNNSYTFMKIIYWKLDILSCVLVLRNREWFKNNIAQLQNVWNIIEHERVSGYEHRAPNKKPKKELLKPFVDATNSNITPSCLLIVKKN